MSRISKRLVVSCAILLVLALAIVFGAPLDTLGGLGVLNMAADENQIALYEPPGGPGEEDEEEALPHELFFRFNDALGELHITPGSYEAALSRSMFFIRGVYVTDELGLPVTGFLLADDGGFDIEAEPGTSFVLTYEATHPVSREVFEAERVAVVVEYYEEDEDNGYEEQEPKVTFEFEGDRLVIEMGEFYEGVEIDAILLRGISAATEKGEDVTHLVEVYDDGGFAEYLRENFAPKPGRAPGMPLRPGFDSR